MPSLIPYPCVLPSPSPFHRKFLLRSSFAFATDVPFTDLFLIYNTYRPVVSFRSLCSYIPPRCPDFVPLLLSLLPLSTSILWLVSTEGSALTFFSPLLRLFTFLFFSYVSFNCYLPPAIYVQVVNV